jgi:hypothetical protein
VPAFVESLVSNVSGVAMTHYVEVLKSCLLEFSIRDGSTESL